jgi:hypothetical protein
MGIGFKLLNRANRAQLLLIIGTGIFAVGALGFIAGYLSQGQTSVLGARFQGAVNGHSNFMRSIESHLSANVANF